MYTFSFCTALSFPPSYSRDQKSCDQEKYFVSDVPTVTKVHTVSTVATCACTGPWRAVVVATNRDRLELDGIITKMSNHAKRSDIQVNQIDLFKHCCY